MKNELPEDPGETRSDWEAPLEANEPGELECTNIRRCVAQVEQEEGLEAASAGAARGV